MGRLWSIAARELLEHRRQPWMLGFISMLMLLVAFAALAPLLVLELAGDAVEMDVPLAAVGIAPRQAVSVAVSALNFLMFSQVLGICAVLAGHAILHDRQCGALPFLLLAPVRRLELLVGKVVGVTLLPIALYLLIGGAAAGVAATLAVSQPHRAQLPPALGWGIAFAISAPSWALCVSSLCAVLSSMARDVRTAQQGVWFIVFFATLMCGSALTGFIEVSGAQLVFALAGVTLCGLVLVGGASIISRDLTQ